MVNLQTNSWITIEYLDDLWISDEAMNQIKANDYLVKWLWIDINGQTSWEKLALAHKENDLAHKERDSLHKRKEQLENILLGS
jgi:predicted acyl esterase